MVVLVDLRVEDEPAFGEDELPQQAVELLQGMECDLVDEEDIDAGWYNTIADSPNPGPVRETVKLLANGIKGNLL